MPQGSFNISRLIAQYGLKNVSELPLAERVQPVISLDTMRGQVPMHQGPVALFGGNVGAQAGQYGTFECISLDPGGFVVSFVFISLASGFITVTNEPVVWGGLGPIPHPPQNFGNQPIASVVNSGTTPIVPTVVHPVVPGIEPGAYAPLFVPRGSRIVFTTLSVFQGYNFSIQIMGVTATQPEIEPVP